MVLLVLCKDALFTLKNCLLHKTKDNSIFLNKVCAVNSIPANLRNSKP